MTTAPVSALEPRHYGGAAGAGRGQWTATPLRVVTDGESYADCDAKVYVKVSALSKRRSCVASVEKIAAYVGIAPSTAEKSLGRLSRPAPTDGVQELFRKQRSHQGTGNGRTNERWCRPLGDDERRVWAPVLAADTLRGTLHRLYLLLRYTILVEKRDLSLAEIAAVLRHHGGKRAGRPLHEGTVARLLDELEGAGWITQDKRAGYRGRHQITVHDDPLRPAADPDVPPSSPDAGPATTPDAEGGATPDLEGGAPAYKEDLQLNDRGSAQERGSFRRRRDHGEWVAPPVDTAGNTAGVPSALRGPVRPSAPPAYAGPALTLSPRVWDVLAPVTDLLATCSDFAVRRIAREIGHQLDTGVLAEDIHDQLQTLRAWTPTEHLTDPARWILGAALPPRPGRCETTDCVRGFQRYTGLPCKACAEVTAARARPPHTAGPSPHATA